ncbi:IS200/IS605 family transposase [Photobacterium leiognathi]|uniref:IS200/IS605 family transposase n=1 Tax=Photobacterium leiognathi TaxID=553611 RepID=UPI001EDFA84F|nr:IS200/IS605 family transposase [Photobacterium leiognathi]MCG3884425.1 IS200/IS605 family transposase [Photobacterium leiognathi]
MKLRKGRHVVYQMHAHLVFLSKYSGECFPDLVLKEMEKMMREICQKNDVILTEFNGGLDYVHIRLEYKPTLMLTKLVNALKGTTSKELKKTFPDLNSTVWRNNALWSPSYYCGSVEMFGIEDIVDCIQSLERP